MQDQFASPMRNPGGNIDQFLAQADRSGIDQLATGNTACCSQQIVADGRDD
ncbi:putative uncharacterized protein [Corynebacterium casei UCMA 3821]|uniref:Uncharacterized protein n=1 Tax=Corynebacterium casei UCMA 3821 TaxID=1110505 RepID=G7HTZ2_9CORY|nr:putative uncharacterized protein [Corynebacterium casei UCMA 3821]CCE54446.1 putative uncharacterized protein [Corynebacterium casei UCMA 3821]